MVKAMKKTQEIVFSIKKYKNRMEYFLEDLFGVDSI